MAENPYQAPEAISYSKQAAMLPGGRRYQHKSLYFLTVGIVVCVAMVSIAGVIVSILELTFESVWPSFNDPNEEFTTETAAMAANLIAGIAVLSIFPALALVVLVPMYSYRSNANLRSLGIYDLKHTPGWCAGYWFIPFANLIRPYQATREVYMTSETRLSNKENHSPMSPYFGLWWSVYLVGNILSNIESRMALRGVYHAESFHVISFLASGLTLVAGILFIRILLRISRNQKAGAEAIVNQSPLA